LRMNAIAKKFQRSIRLWYLKEKPSTWKSKMQGEKDSSRSNKPYSKSVWKFSVNKKNVCRSSEIKPTGTQNLTSHSTTCSLSMVTWSRKWMLIWKTKKSGKRFHLKKNWRNVSRIGSGSCRTKQRTRRIAWIVRTCQPRRSLTTR
jgi:hypothetical protein